MLFRTFFTFLAFANASTIVGVVTNSLEGGGTASATIDSKDGSLSGTVGFGANLTGVLPECFAALPGGRAVMCVSVGAVECLQFFSSTNGTSNMQSWCSHELVIDNVGYDHSSNTLVFGAFNMTSQTNFVYSISHTHPEAGPTVLLRVPGIVQVAINAISSSKHLLFLTLQIDGSDNNLLTIDLVKRSIVYNVTVQQGIESLFYDDVSQTLFVWCATEEWAAALYKLNYQTGEVLGDPLYTSLSLSSNEAALVYDTSTQTMYAQLFGLQNGNWPSWVTVNVSTRKSTVTPVSQSTAYPWILNMALNLN